MEEESTGATVRRPRIGHPLNIPADDEKHAPLRRARRIIDDQPAVPPVPPARGGDRGRFPAGGGLGEAPRTQNAPAAATAAATAATAATAAPGDSVSIPDGVAIVDANPGGVGVEAVVAVAATLAHLAPGVVRLTIRPLGRFGAPIDLFSTGRVILDVHATGGDGVELTVIERTRRDARTVAGVAPSHTLQGEWEWDAAAGAFALARGTMAWACDAPNTARRIPSTIARALAAAIARGDPAMDGVAVQVASSASSVWRPAAHGLPVARRCWRWTRPGRRRRPSRGRRARWPPPALARWWTGCGAPCSARHTPMPSCRAPARMRRRRRPIPTPLAGCGTAQHPPRCGRRAGCAR